MIIRNSSYDSFAKMISKTSKKIIVYGAGMIGQIVIPYIIREYNLYEQLDCFIDMDKRKKGQVIVIADNRYEINTPDYLEKIDDNYIIMITNSKFFPVIKYLDGISNLNHVEGYIVPIMQISELENATPIELSIENGRQLIPRTIHYCWFGKKEMPDFLRKCIASWEEMCPDYQIIEWNESNFDVNKYEYTKEAYEKGKYGFVSDMARLDILYENGGIYMDTDVTLVRNLDILLHQEGFIGTEKWGNINSGGGCGFIHRHPMVKAMLDYRKQYHFILSNGSLNIETNGMYETRSFIEKGFKPNNSLQIIDGVVVYPSYVNHPYDYMSCSMHNNKSTVSIHHFYGGWMEEEDQLNRKNTQNQFQAVMNRINNGGR